ncbi:MAG: hypothetical protein GY732_13865, partial [Gammaproteobacteria bacterium]|nr:hypothetical protein [Gammaproteobacteria bacterium]
MKNAREFPNRYKRSGPVSLPIFAIGLVLSMGQVLADEFINETGLAVFSDVEGDRIGLVSDGYDEEVIVTEWPVMHRQTGRTKLGFPIESIELKRR